ncbi:MAG TPA: glycosyltransferase family 4 protein [Gemmataceae bacterium]|nr:glycosyltransferase family 4 protein [Gemmataceae bacterium]
MRIVALVKSPEHVCCRYRLAAFRPDLEAAGHRLELRTWPRRWQARRWGREIGSADMIILQRKIPPPWMLSLFRQAAPCLIYDFDDAVFIRDSFTGWGPHWPGRARSFARVVRAAEVVVAGNRFLFDHAALWTGPEKIHLVPTCLDPDRYPLARHTSKKNIQLVWIGSSSTLRGMERVRPLLEMLGQRLPGLQWKIICDRFLKLNVLPVIRCPWSEAGEAIDLASADIGISWLPDDLWSQGKCGLKILQYMAAGLPVVANPVGMQASLVRDGETGFLVRTEDEWHDAIARLAADPGLRRHMGLAGRAVVEANYNMTGAAGYWRDLLEKLGSRAFRIS